MLSNSLTQISPSECIGNSLSAINSNFSQIGTKVDAIETTLGTNVSKIVAGTNITVSPSSGTGIVTINSTINNNSIVLSGTNLGTVGASVFKEKSGQNLAFKRIIGTGTNIIVTEDSNTIKIAALGVNGTIGVVPQNIGDGLGIAGIGTGQVLPFKSLKGGTGIRLADGSSAITILADLSGKNVGTGATLYKTVTGNSLLFKSLVNGTPNVSIQNRTDDVVISVNETTTGLAIGQGASVFKDKQANGLLFRSLLSSTPNVVITERAQDITIGVNEATTGKNIGEGEGLIFAQKSGNSIQFKTLKKGNNIQITDNGQEIRLDATLQGSGGGEVNEGRNVGTGAPVYKAKDGIDLVFRTLSAGPGITINESSNVLTISAIPPIMGRGDVLGADNLGQTTNSVGFYTGVKTSNGILNFKSLSGGPGIAIKNSSTNVSVQLSGVVVDGINSIFGIGEGELYKGKSDSDTLEYRKLKAGAGMQIVTGTHDVIISSTVQASLDALATSFKNKVINGNFDVWQWANRSTINPTTGIVSHFADLSATDRSSIKSNYLADRWAFYAGKPTTGGSGDQYATFVKQIASTNETLAIPSRPAFYGRIALNQRANGIPGVQVVPTALMHRIENVLMLGGKTVTLSFYAKSNNTGSSKLPLYLNQYYKASFPQYNTYYKDTPIAEFEINEAWQRYNVTFTVPPIRRSIMSAAWGTFIQNLEQVARESFTQLVFEIPGTEGRYLDITAVQLEEGTIPTTFEPRPYTVELQLCQRYFENGTSLISQVGIAEPSNKTEIPFKVTKRIAPLMRTDNRTVILKNTGTNGEPNISNHVVSEDTSITHLRTIYTATGNGIITRPYVYNWAADAEFFI
jgi:hypothetical protein